MSLIKHKKSNLSNGLFAPSAVKVQNGAPTINPSLVETQAKSLIQSKVDELWSRTQSEIESQRTIAEHEAQRILEDAGRQAQTIISEAETNAEIKEQEIEKAQEKLEAERHTLNQLAAQEKQKAFNDGLEKGKHYINELMLWLNTFNNVKKNLLIEVKYEIASLALDIAKQILGREVAINPEALEEQVLRSIGRVVNTKGIVQIYLNPDELKKSEMLELALKKIIDPAVRIVFMKDESIDLGSCIINTQGGRLDASFKTQIDVIKSSFEKYLGHSIEEIPATLEKDPLDDVLDALLYLEPDDEDLDKTETEMESIYQGEVSSKGGLTVAPKPKDSKIEEGEIFEDEKKIEIVEDDEVDENDFEEFDENAGGDDIGSDSNFDDDVNRDFRYPEY